MPTSSAPAPPSTVDLGHPVLGVTAGWELFGRGPDSVVRIELAKGRLTRTTVPGLGSSGPVSFLVGPNRAIVRPLDFVPGFAVTDGQQITGLAGALASHGPAIPGPDPAHVWADTDPGGHADVMTLVDLDGRMTPTHLAVPANSSAVGATSDGAGHVLLTGSDGAIYQGGPDRPQLLTRGTLLAVGPTAYLLSECGPSPTCLPAVVDRKTNKRRTLTHSILPLVGAVGLISPDGKTAAVIDLANPGLSLINLTSGIERASGPDIGEPTRAGSMVWSPDSRWLFVATEPGRVAVIDADTGKVGDLGFRLPVIEQLAIRAAPTSHS